MNRPIGIALGDVTGIGPEVTLKALASQPDDGTRFLILGDAGVLARTSDVLGIELPLVEWAHAKSRDRFLLHSPLAGPLPRDLCAGAPAAARAALAFLREGAERCLRAELAALVTAPVNKHAIARAGVPFTGQTEFLSELAGHSRTVMMLLGHDAQGRWLRVALATTHLAIRRVAEAVTPERIRLAIELAAQACSDLQLPRSRIAVCGLNPHAGEGGEFGDEDQSVIAPAVAAAIRAGFDAVGPLAADTVFYHAIQGDFDAVVAMYHDQGLGPLKLVAFETGVNWTLGLPFTRTSPDHGTAHDIAGKCLANPSSMAAAIALARRLSRSGSRSLRH